MKGSVFLSKFFKILTVVLTAFSIALFSLIFMIDNDLNDNYKVTSKDGFSVDSLLPVKVTYEGTNIKNVSSTFSVGSNYDVEMKILGVIPVAKANLEVVDEIYVLPLGLPFGMKLYTDGLLVVDLTDVDAADGYVNPAKKAGLKVGDLIVSANGKKVYSNTDLSEIIEKSNGEQITFVIKRDSKNLTIKFKAVKSKSSCVYKAGIWVRDSSAGIGTLTFYSPATDVICGLGHGVYDDDTGKLLTINTGEIYASEIISYQKGKSGSPGELKGRITKTKFADIISNCTEGVYGYCSKTFDTTRVIPVAMKQEVENGTAYIMTTIEGDTPTLYTCTVKKIKNSNDNQNMIIEITDKELLNATGGILQGMSGSPIIQNGKLIGAVTHVLIDTPEKGYGIYAEKMLETAQNSTSKEVKEAS